MTHTCQKLAVHLSAYYDKELEGLRLAEVEAHLHGCPTCQKKMNAYRALSQSVKSAHSLDCVRLSAQQPECSKSVQKSPLP